VRLVQREGASTHAAALANGVATPNRSLASPPLPVAPRKLYLYGGWLRSLAGNAYLGWQWLSRDGSTGAPTEYLLGGVQNGPWQAAYRLLDPPPGAEALQALLLNVRTTGTALYDDLLLLPLDAPGAPQARPGDEVR
jgi:hypothetical protein